MKTLFITISRGALVRNFLHTGVVSRILDQGIRVVVLTPNYQDTDLFKDFEHDNLILEPLFVPKNKFRFQRIIRELLKGSIFNKTVHHLYRSKLCGKDPSKILYVPRLVFLYPLKFIPGFKKFVRWFDFKLNPQTEHDYLFQKYHPDLVFATTAHAVDDISVLKSAKRFGVKTVQMPKSWDNLSKILFNVKTDKMIVWSPFMKEQALKYQDYKDSEIMVTGAPQFDFYQPKNLVSREEFCQKFGFDPSKKIILYGSNGVNQTYEFQYPKLIKQYIEEGKLQDVQVLIRPHLGYVGDEKQFLPLADFEGFAVDTVTDKQNHKFKDHWDTSFNHLSNLYNSLYHADVVVTIASTLIFDAISAGTPVISIKFDVEDGIPLGESVKRFYKTDYVDVVANKKEMFISHDKDEFLDQLKEVLSKNKGEYQFDEFIKYFMYKADGNSAKRVADSLLSCLN